MARQQNGENVVHLCAVAALVMLSGCSPSEGDKEWEAISYSPVVRVCEGGRWPVYVREYQGRLYANHELVAEGISPPDVCK